MTQNLQHELKAYQKSIRKRLPPLNRQQRHTLLAIFKEMEEYDSEFPDASIADIQEKFGSPEVIAASIIPAEDTLRLKRQFRKNLCLIVVAAVLAVAVLYMSIILYYIYKDQKNYMTYSDPTIHERVD